MVTPVLFEIDEKIADMLLQMEEVCLSEGLGPDSTPLLDFLSEHFPQLMQRKYPFLKLPCGRVEKRPPLISHEIQELHQLEEKLAADIAEKLKSFRDATGLSIGGIEIHLIEVTTSDERSRDFILGSVECEAA